MDEKIIGLILLSVSLLISEILPFISESHKGIAQASIAGTQKVYSALFVDDTVLPK